MSNTLLALALSVSAAVAAPATMPGIPRYINVNDVVARGGQPTSEGFRSLASAGFRSVVNLTERDDRSKREKKLVESLGMRYVQVPMKGMRTPDERDIAKALKTLENRKDGPVFVHCKRGADRTGVVVACYRIEHDGWSNREALQEAREVGMYWYQIPLQRYISSYRPHGHAITDKIGDLLKKPW